jgi:DNA-directed RNA polymerase subunit F
MVSYQRPVATTAINKVAETIADLIPPRISEIRVIMAIVKYQGELARMLSSGFSTPTVTA